MSVPVAQNLQNKLWSINAVQALETSGQTESQTYETESTVTACPASSYRESPGLCLCVCVCVFVWKGWVWLSLNNQPWFTAESGAGASTGLQNEAVITTPPPPHRKTKKTFSHLAFPHGVTTVRWESHDARESSQAVLLQKQNVSWETDFITNTDVPHLSRLNQGAVINAPRDKHLWKVILLFT